MNSLRFRLVVGFAMVAIVPLLIAMLVLSQRIQRTVQAQATERLDAAVEAIVARLKLDAESTRERIVLLARDPELRRLALVEPSGSRALAELLAEKRALLGIDALALRDSAGAVLADAADAPSALAATEAEPPRLPPAIGHAAPAPATQRIEGDSALALVAEAPLLYQGAEAAVVRAGSLLDREWLMALARTSGLELILRDSEGNVVVSTLPAAEMLARDAARSAGLGWTGAAPPPRTRLELETVVVPGRGSYIARAARLEPPVGPSLTGLASTSAAEQAIGTLRITALSFGLLGLGVAILLGLLWSHQLSAPVERLARFSARVARGEWDEPLAMRSVSELETLVTALDRMRTDLRAQRERLAVSERHAAWSVMARAVAHEVRNPLTPIAVSVADLKRSYELKRPDFPAVLDQAVRTIGDEIESLKRMLAEFSELGRFPEPVLAPCRVADVVADLEALYAGDVAEGRLAFARPPADQVVSADRGQLRQALVNLVKNALEAIAPGGRVHVSAGADGTDAEIRVADDGPGLTREQRARLFEPRFTTKPHGSGLGLTIAHRIVNDHRGTIAVDTAPGRGTTFRIRLPLAREE